MKSSKYYYVWSYGQNNKETMNRVMIEYMSEAHNEWLNQELKQGFIEL
jgi:hypothetical protein